VEDPKREGLIRGSDVNFCIANSVFDKHTVKNSTPADKNGKRKSNLHHERNNSLGVIPVRSDLEVTQVYLMLVGTIVNMPEVLEFGIAELFFFCEFTEVLRKSAKPFMSLHV